MEDDDLALGIGPGEGDHVFGGSDQMRAGGVTVVPAEADLLDDEQLDLLDELDEGWHADLVEEPAEPTPETTDTADTDTAAAGTADTETADATDPQAEAREDGR